MKRFFFRATGLLASICLAATVASANDLSVAQIVDKNVTARGGLGAWRAVNTLTLSGQIDVGGNKATTLPFVLTMKRPHRSRFELRFREQTALQVYNGAQGWKVRPFLGRDEVEPYTSAEAKSAAAATELDGPLIDYLNKGTKVELVGVDSVQGHRAYKLKLTMKERTERYLWLDANSFLELKIDGDPRVLDGRMHNVAIYYSDYQTEGGLTFPHGMETVVEGTKQSHKLTIQHVAVNQAAADALFEKPQLALINVPGR